jgi:hypothetical protein
VNTPTCRSGNHHPGVQRDNVFDHVEKHRGHAGKQDTNAPHRRFFAPVSTEETSLELSLIKWIYRPEFGCQKIGVRIGLPDLPTGLMSAKATDPP